jgi:signal transduction histidine kinase
MPDMPSRKSPVKLPGLSMLRRLRDDRVLLSAIAAVVVLIAYQLIVMLIQPPWIKPVTDWLRTALAWPQFIVVAYVAFRVARTKQQSTVAWIFVGLGMLSYAVARTSWTIADVWIFPHGVPFPSLPDFFFILQYPCFLVALFFIPADRGWLPSLRTMMDGVLWMSAITALSWYFVLWPMSLQTGELRASKYISIGYQIGDLVLFYGLIVVLTRPHRTAWDQVVIGLLAAAVASLFIADTWAAVLLLHPPHTYRTGSAPDLFWYICYLLIPLAAVVRLRIPAEVLAARPVHVAQRPQWGDLLGGVQFVLPSAVVVAAGVVILLTATHRMQSTAGLILPEEVTCALLLLATLRPAVLYIEQQQLRREREAAEARESALRVANERMQVFLTVLAHELRTPLTSLVGNIQLMARRLDALLRLDGSREDYLSATTLLRALVERCDQSLARLGRLVGDAVDDTRIQQGRLELRQQPCDLAVVAGEAIANLKQLHPTREIRYVTTGQPAPVVADVGRIEQVVTNFVSNALKFSRETQVVEVREDSEDGMARLAVHDDGIGVPPEDQPHIWDRFYQTAVADVQAGSHIGFGLGLYISKTIIERHHGQVGIESAAGQGTTIWFTLPLAGGAATAGEAAAATAPAANPNDRA